jgi:hypothetical protein
MKEPTGRDADNIAFGSTLSRDRHEGKLRLSDREIFRTALRRHHDPVATGRDPAALRTPAAAENQGGFIVGAIGCGNFHRGRLAAGSVLPIFTAVGGSFAWTSPCHRPESRPCNRSPAVVACKPNS